MNENAGHFTFTITRSSSSAAATVYASTVADQGYSNPNGDYYYVGSVNQAVSFSFSLQSGLDPAQRSEMSHAHSAF